MCLLIAKPERRIPDLMRRLKLAAGGLLIVFLYAATAYGQKPFLQWNSLSNPVLSYPNWSIKDAAMAYRNGTFYVFFSAFYQDRGRVRSHVVEVSTRDFKHYSKPILNFDGVEAGWIGMCSPDVHRWNGQYVMTFNSWGFKPGKPNELFYRTSHDLEHWSKRHTLALNLTGSNPVIDAALAAADGGYYLMWKEGPHGKMKPRLAFSKSLTGPFKFVGNGFPALLMPDGKEDGMTHENYQFIHAGDKWYLLSADYMPQTPHLYELQPGSGWLKWVNGRALEFPEQQFNKDFRANAAAIYDWRDHDGYFYIIYAGCNERKTFARRGWNRLGLARSKDLIHWRVAGQME